MKTLIAVSLLMLAAAARAEERFTPEQREARFYYDLGPNEVDVSAYPKEQQEHYKAFAKACSQCHTLARAISSPLVTREDWRRFIKRMYAKTKPGVGKVVSKGDAVAAIDFLAYDSQVRKVKEKAAFAAKTRELKALFAEVRKERSRVQVETDKKHVQEPAPYTGTK
jgi:hypothetical protein